MTATDECNLHSSSFSVRPDSMGVLLSLARAPHLSQAYFSVRPEPTRLQIELTIFDAAQFGGQDDVFAVAFDIQLHFFANFVLGNVHT